MSDEIKELIKTAGIALALVLLFTLCLLTTCNAQTVLHNCPIGGRPASFDDSMKNRYEIPKTYTKLPFAVLAKQKYNAKSSGAVTVTGYCILVKDGGPETCNCKSKDHEDWDVHIEITQDSSHTSNKDAIICEINGRMKAIMKVQGIDWSMPAIRKLILHHTVQISGYLFSDTHHKQNSIADNPDGTDDWRSSCWEIHPVTAIKIIR